MEKLGSILAFNLDSIWTSNSSDNFAYYISNIFSNLMLRISYII